MTKYVKKPIPVDVWKITSEYSEYYHGNIPDWVQEAFKDNTIYLSISGKLVVSTLEGSICGNIGDYLIKGVQGELYPCRKDIFEETYEEYDERQETNEDTGATEQPDMVNEPPHYNHGGMETIDEMILIFGKEAVAAHCLCTSWKYRARAPYKWNAEEDMRKSDWYINKYKELMEE